MNPESPYFTQKRRYRLTVARVGVIVSLIAAAVALANVLAVRDHLCYEHHMNMFCSIAQIGESEVRVFAWHPEVKPFDRSASTPRSALSEILPEEKRAYGSRFPSGQRQWLYWEARLKSREPPGRSIRFIVHWTTYAAGDHAVAGGVVEATWGADDPAVLIIGPVDTVPVQTSSQFPPGRYEIVLNVYGNQLAESKVRGGFKIY
ncbi:hypothetical protein [Candidatus Methylomirabilis sp.]|uniref:hypothetical protein n=1 Tax=Candidatus Methylomirabilis sp. TaxID=2032687 RepID=UPI002A5F780A|nr:hypothetical protein [Candidatus Methylomirabilis sp.]